VDIGRAEVPRISQKIKRGTIMTRPTDNAAKLPFSELPRDVQDKIARALRGERVEVFARRICDPISEWGRCEFEPRPESIYRLPPETDIEVPPTENRYRLPTAADIGIPITGTPPAKGPNRPRPAHKLELEGGDVVQLVCWQCGRECCVGETFAVGQSSILDNHISSPNAKGHRPLFIVVSRAGGDK
jgi:hypothetical protein